MLSGHLCPVFQLPNSVLVHRRQVWMINAGSRPQLYLPQIAYLQRTSVRNEAPERPIKTSNTHWFMPFPPISQPSGLCCVCVCTAHCFQKFVTGPIMMTICSVCQLYSDDLISELSVGREKQAVFFFWSLLFYFLCFSPFPFCHEAAFSRPSGDKTVRCHAFQRWQRDVPLKSGSLPPTTHTHRSGPLWKQTSFYR